MRDLKTVMILEHAINYLAYQFLQGPDYADDCAMQLLDRLISEHFPD